MALGLLALGLGIGGGVSFLEQRKDDREAENALQSYQPIVDQLGDYGPAFQARAQQIADRERGLGSFFGPSRSKEEEIDNLFNSYLDSANTARQLQQQDLQNQIAKQGQRTQAFAQLDSLRGAADDRLSTVQTGVRAAIQALDVGDSMAGYEATLRMLQTLLTDEAIMEGDLSAAQAAGGWMAELAGLVQRFDPTKKLPGTLRNQMAAVLERAAIAEQGRWDITEQEIRERAAELNVSPESAIPQFQGIDDLTFGGYATEDDSATDPVAAQIARQQALIEQQARQIELLQQQNQTMGGGGSAFPNVDDWPDAE